MADLTLLDRFHEIAPEAREDRLEDFLADTESPVMRDALVTAAHGPGRNPYNLFIELDDASRHVALRTFLDISYGRGVQVSVVPVDARLSREDTRELKDVIIPAFEGKIGSVEVAEGITTGKSELSVGYLAKLLLDAADGRLTMAYTDSRISVCDQSAGGFGFRMLGIAAVSSYNIPQVHQQDAQRKISRIAGVALHELGHMFGLEHHDKEVEDSRLCPMANRTPDDFPRRLEKGYRMGYRRFLDSRSERFCGECYSRISGIR